MGPQPDTPEARARLEVALAAIDAANAGDPQRLRVRGEIRPKELAHADLVTEWVLRLCRDASEALQIAARAHHVRRWEISRKRYPQGRAGYLRWRSDLQKHHGKVTRDILRDAGYDAGSIDRVSAILRKRGLGRDREVQAFEDALCLTFIETQLAAFAGDHLRDKARDVLAKTLRKMSPEARELARGLPLSEPARGVLLAALELGES